MSRDYTLTGYNRWDERIYLQEGLDKKSLYEDWRNNYSKRIEVLQSSHVDNDTPYIIPPISHVVYFTNPSDIKSWKEVYINKYTKSTTRLNNEAPESTHYIWTNLETSVPEAVRALPNVVIKTFDAFQDHPLMPHMQALLEKAKTDSSLFTQTSDVARVMVQQAYGGVYHDLDYEIFDAAELVRHMKVASFIGGKEDDGNVDAFMGNAFIASTKGHPVLEDLSLRITRNLDLTENTPDYIRYPYNKFDSVICSTGPIALMLSYFTIQKQHGDHSPLPPMMMLKAAVVYDKESALRETEATIKTLPPKGTIGGDMFSGGWGTSAYLAPIEYTIKDMLAKYSLPTEEVDTAPCFSNPSSSLKALEVLEKAYRLGSTLDDKYINIQKAFTLIKDLKTHYRIKAMEYVFIAIEQYGLDPEEVKNAACFSDSLLAEKALKVLENAYNLDSNPEDKSINIQKAFTLIKDLKTHYRIEEMQYVFSAIEQYGLNPEETKTSLCFSNSLTGKAALEVLEKVYNLDSGQDNQQINIQKTFALIKDLDTSDKIEAVIQYKLDPEEVKNTACFKYISVSEKALEVLEKAYRLGSTLDDKYINVQKVFTLIKDLDSSKKIKAMEYVFIAIEQYGLDPEEVKNAACFSDSLLAEKALKVLENAYNLDSNPEDKKTHAQEAFILIKDLDSNEKIEAVVTYKLNLEEIKTAAFFSYNMVWPAALQALREAYQLGLTTEDKHTNAQRVFTLIKDCSHEYEIEALVTDHLPLLLQYRLNPKEVKNTSCFGNFSSAKKTSELLKKAYDLGSTLDDKYTNAQRLFTLIKDTEDNDYLKIIEKALASVQQPQEAFGAMLNALLVHHATITQNQEIVHLLLEYGANPNYEAVVGTPLLVYLSLYHETLHAVIQEFVDHGADVNAVDSYGNHAVTYALKHHDKKLFEILIEGHRANLDFSDINTAFLLLVEEEQQQHNEDYVEIINMFNAEQDYI